jgi:hypothetical protein
VKNMTKKNSTIKNNKYKDIEAPRTARTARTKKKTTLHEQDGLQKGNNSPK